MPAKIVGVAKAVLVVAMTRTKDVMEGRKERVKGVNVKCGSQLVAVENRTERVLYLSIGAYSVGPIRVTHISYKRSIASAREVVKRINYYAFTEEMVTGSDCIPARRLSFSARARRKRRVGA